MTKKEVTTVMYQQLKRVNNLETKIINDKFYHIFQKKESESRVK
jgi:hypothetical protein